MYVGSDFEKSPASYQSAWILLTELALGGVKHYSICPGSRSTSLALCAWGLNSASISVHHDERSAGFFALGKAIQKKEPVAIITTSGTAVAELLPAAVEAFLSQIPLVFLTADRPKYLRRTGSNQTISQEGMLGTYVKRSLEIPCLDSGSLQVLEKILRRKVCSALEETMGRDGGPLHINVQLEKPFEPYSLRFDDKFQHSSPNSPYPKEECLTERKLKSLSKKMAAAEFPAVVVGPNRLGPGFSRAVKELAKTYNMPVFADPLSGCRGFHDEECKGTVSSYEILLQAETLGELQFDLILRFGHLPVSTRLSDFINSALVRDGIHIYVNSSGRIHDENFGVTDYIQANPLTFCQQMNQREQLKNTPDSWLDRWHRLTSIAETELAIQLAQEQVWEGGFVAALLQELPADCMLFAGNSLPIRLVDLVGAVRTETLEVIANRGASGIDGIVSTALGMAHGHASKVVLLIGDTSLLYDVGGLAAIRQLGMDNVLIVVLNNNGGGIFGHLPVADLESPFEELFVNPHGMDFSKIASSFDLAYSEAKGLTEFRREMQTMLNAQRSSILEVQTDRRQDLRQAQELVQRVAQHIGE